MSTLANPLRPSFNDDTPGPSVKGALAWMDLMEACEELLLAGLRRQVGPDGDIWGAYQDWYRRQTERRDRERRQRYERPRITGGRNGV
jgi:hypothetical protein